MSIKKVKKTGLIMVAQNPGLTMKFREKTDDVVSFDATAEDKQSLLKMIDASIADLETNRVEILMNTGAQQDQLDEMHAVISETVDNDEPVTMQSDLFKLMGSLAVSWKFDWFDRTTPEEQETIDVSKQTVETLLEVRSDVYEM